MSGLAVVAAPFVIINYALYRPIKLIVGAVTGVECSDYTATAFCAFILLTTLVFSIAVSVHSHLWTVKVSYGFTVYFLSFSIVMLIVVITIAFVDMWVNPMGGVAKEERGKRTDEFLIRYGFEIAIPCVNLLAIAAAFAYVRAVDWPKLIAERDAAEKKKAKDAEIKRHAKNMREAQTIRDLADKDYRRLADMLAASKKKE
jgi:hypothetical protein